MIEQGLVMYVQAGLAALSSPVVVPGGFDTELPKDLISPAVPMAWAYRSITADPSYNLQAETGWTEWCVQIDCFGLLAANKIQMARAIQKVLEPGFQGQFPDPDLTRVFGIFRNPTQVDGFTGETNRIYVRSLEYTIQYLQT